MHASRAFNPSAGRLLRRGYTLVELIIVIAILGLAGSLLIPYLVQGDTLSIQGAVRQVIADLTFAQSDALANQEMRRVYFYDDGSGYCIYRVADGEIASAFDPESVDYVNDPLAPAGEFNAYIVKLTEDEGFENITIDGVALDGSNRFITFDELGGTLTTSSLPGTGGTITLRSPNAAYQITVAGFTGKLTVQSVE
jgi:prepilin-type N-terminal cleavage/methylation domain-containing protein